MLEKTNIRSLFKNEIDEIKIVFSILEGYDTLDYIVQHTKLSKSRVEYLLRLFEKAGLLYKKEGTKRWRVRVDYYRVWRNAEYVYYNEREIVTGELESVKELRDLEEKLTHRR